MTVGNIKYGAPKSSPMMGSLPQKTWSSFGPESGAVQNGIFGTEGETSLAHAASCV